MLIYFLFSVVLVRSDPKLSWLSYIHINLHLTYHCLKSRRKGRNLYSDQLAADHVILLSCRIDRSMTNQTPKVSIVSSKKRSI